MGSINFIVCAKIELYSFPPWSFLNMCCDRDKVYDSTPIPFSTRNRKWGMINI